MSKTFKEMQEELEEWMGVSQPELQKQNKIPKDREILIKTDTGTHIARYSPADGKFVYANLLIDMYEGKWDMYYYETEYIKENFILGWMEI